MFRSPATKFVSTVPNPSPRPLDETVLALCRRLGTALERVTRKRVDQLINYLFALIRGEAGPASLKRAMRSAGRGQRRLLRALTRQFLRDIEMATRAKTREALRRERQARKTAARSAAVGPRGPRPRRRLVRPPPPPLDPEQIKRDAETQRLRALLRPATEEPTPPPTPVVIPPPSPTSGPPSTPGGFLRALEREIQDAVPYLGPLGPERCGAQIAAWAGQVRELRDRLLPETFATMRPAFRIFLEHLVELRTALDAHFVDALEPKWHPPSWPDYIEANLARAQGRPPALSTDRLHSHHRSMLRALVLPHRKNVREQALAVIAAAAEVLPEDDSLLRSARRRHSERRPAHPLPEPPVGATDELFPDEPPESAEGDAAGQESTPALPESFPAAFQESVPPEVSGEPLPEEGPPSPPDPPAEDESEFERPWTK
jgi:hypothetical protein